MNETSIIEKLGTFELDKFKFNNFIEKSIRKLGMPLSQHLRKIPNFDNCNAIEKVILIIQFDFSKLSGMRNETVQKLFQFRNNFIEELSNSNFQKFDKEKEESYEIKFNKLKRKYQYLEIIKNKGSLMSHIEVFDELNKIMFP
jgi:hypothetical protein